MIRKVFKKTSLTARFTSFIEKYNIRRQYLSINRRSVTRGLMVGLFWMFIPMPFQMVAVIAMTPFFAFNVPLALLMVWLSNPATMPLMYYIEYLTGNFILNLDGVEKIELKMSWFTTNWDAIVLPLYVGAMFYAIVVPLLVYIIVDWLWVKSVQNAKKDKDAKINSQTKPL